tara:strand:+ start:292 stop:543 length:252 start_codon:yes stop_codon:yes gene_type:complete
LTVSIRPLVFNSSIENFLDLQERQNTRKKLTMLVGFIMGHAKIRQYISKSLYRSALKTHKILQEELVGTAGFEPTAPYYTFFQ